MPLVLAPLFTDHMVLQQGRPVPVWGTTTPDDHLTVSFAEHTITTTADAYGNWLVHLPALAACCQPRSLTVASQVDGVTLSLRDVLVGEVWICSGQSNMQFALAQANNGVAEVRAANYPHIRLYLVPNVPADAPVRAIKAGPWKVCSPAAVATFSAVGYCFGRELNRTLDVPVGLVNSSWGGTVAEAWTSRQTLLASPVLRPLVEDHDRQAWRYDELFREWQAACAGIEARIVDRGNAGHPAGWAKPGADLADWVAKQLPGNWDICGFRTNGVIWHRRDVDLPAAWAGKPLKLAIGACDKGDLTYFNDTCVGSLTMADSPDSWSTPRTYDVPGDLVKAGANTIAVRVYSEKFQGGMTGPAELMSIAPADGFAAPLPLAGAWHCRIEQDYGLTQLPPCPPGPGTPNRPAVLYQGMIWPLHPYAVAGAIWYQGESNVGRATQYRTLFPEMIRDWRRTWGYEFSFYHVQLANYMGAQPEPGESTWAELREAQNVALRLPNTGTALAIDIGEAGDIHPKNKQEVGRRLALNALALTYGRDVEYAGPTVAGATVEGGSMRIAFDHADGLHARGDGLRGFAIAGANGRFVWGQATIQGTAVLISSPEVPEPVAVRYAWADNPVADLYNAAGLPANPFRTDEPA